MLSPYFPEEQIATQSLEGEISPQLFDGHCATQILVLFSPKPVVQKISQVPVKFSPYQGVEHKATQILFEKVAQELEGQYAMQILLEFSANPVMQVAWHSQVEFSPNFPEKQEEKHIREGEVSPQLFELH